MPMRIKRWRGPAMLAFSGPTAGEAIALTIWKSVSRLAPAKPDAKSARRDQIVRALQAEKLADEAWGIVGRRLAALVVSAVRMRRRVARDQTSAYSPLLVFDRPQLRGGNRGASARANADPGGGSNG
jgi:hypothetical protein